MRIVSVGHALAQNFSKYHGRQIRVRAEGRLLDNPTLQEQ